MVKKVILMFLFLVSITLTSAVTLQPEAIDKDLRIYQECNNCTYCNFTRVIYGGEIIVKNVSATKDGSHFDFIVGAGNLTERDTLTYCYICGNDVESVTGCNDIPLTYNGHELTVQTAVLYIMFIVLLIGLFVFLFILLHYIPSDTKDDEGYVLGVSKLAYLKPVIKGGMWLLLTSITFLSANVAIAYLDTGMFGDFIFRMFQLMMLSNLVILPLCVIYMIQRITLSKEMAGLIERGVQFQ